MALTLQVIEWRQDDGTEVVHRYEPGGEIRLGAQLTVTENQWAVLFRDGRAYDVFEAGRHVLSTRNIPLLVELLKLPYGGQTPFRADVYFVARKLFADQRWGTREPVVFRDPQFGMLRLRAHGRYAVSVADPRHFLNVLVGTLGRYTTQQLEDYLREVIVARLNDALGELAIPLLDLPRQYDEIAEELTRRATPDFVRLGLNLASFYIGAIVPPEEVARVIDERSSMAAVGLSGDYLRFKAARALGDAALGAQGTAADGAAGGAASGLGIGVGAGLGMALPGMLREWTKGTDATASAAPVERVACRECASPVPGGARFCPQCGALQQG